MTASTTPVAAASSTAGAIGQATQALAAAATAAAEGAITAANVLRTKGFNPMVRDPAQFPLASVGRPEVPEGVGAFSGRVSSLNGASVPRPGVTRSPVNRFNSNVAQPPATLPPPVKFDNEAFMANLPEETRALYQIEGRHDVLAPLVAVAVYSDEDFKHAIEKTAYQTVYRCYLTGDHLVHLKRPHGTFLQMPVKTFTENKTFKPRFKAGEGKDHLAELGAQLGKKGLNFGDFNEFIKAAGLSSEKLYEAIGHKGFNGVATGTLKRELDLNGFFPEGKRPPLSLMHQVIKLFREVCKRGSSQLEAHIMIVWVPKVEVTAEDGTKLEVPGRYEVRVPTQRVSGASVSYDHDAYDPATELCVIDVHSHNNMGE